MDCEFYSQEFDVRKNCAIKLANIYQDRMPIIVYPKKGTKLKKIQQSRLQIPEHYFVGHVIKHIRSNLDLQEDKTIFLYAKEKVMIKPDTVINDAWSKYKNDDGFLYISYSEVSSFG